MYFRIIIGCLLACSSTIVLAQQNKADVQEHEYYEFFDSVSRPTQITRFVLESESGRFDISDNSDVNYHKLFDTIFDKNDSAFLEYQVSRASHFNWGSGMIPGSKVVSTSDLNSIFQGDFNGWERFNKLFGADGYWVYSVPLFSKDKTTCVVRYSNYCGERCGAGYIYYYKKIAGKWKVVYHYRTWVS